MPRTPVAAIIACAMDEELAPFLTAAAAHPALPPRSDNDQQRFYSATLEGLPVVLVRTGIGLTNAAAAAQRALEHFAPQVYILAGTTGGLAPGVNVREVIAGTSTRYLDADATAFGYEPGQVPQMPTHYSSPVEVPVGVADKVGEVTSGNSFVTSANVGDARTRFPKALAVDMETVGAAQVCYLFDVPWLSLRAVSDLCGPSADQDFHVEADTAAEISYRAVTRFLRSQ